MSMCRRGDLLKAADVYLDLGEIQVEEGKFEAAISEFGLCVCAAVYITYSCACLDVDTIEACLKTKREFLPNDNRELAEVYV